MFGTLVATRTTTTGKPSPGRVLIIDDEANMRLLFCRSLQSAGFDVVMASSGVEGLEVLRSDPQIRLILLDLNMPVMNGWDFRDIQRADVQLKDIPTVIVTGEPLAKVVHRQLDVADYLLKPVGRDHLVSVVSEYCEPIGW